MHFPACGEIVANAASSYYLCHNQALLSKNSIISLSMNTKLLFITSLINIRLVVCNIYQLFPHCLKFPRCTLSLKVAVVHRIVRNILNPINLLKTF
jgi:hypothetical protein